MVFRGRNPALKGERKKYSPFKFLDHSSPALSASYRRVQQRNK